MAADLLPSGTPSRVFLVDDHEVVRRGLRALLADVDDVEVVGEADGGSSSLEQVLACRPDVAIVDLRLGDASGVELCQQIRTKDPGIAVLILTAHDDEASVEAALLAGAAGYVLKQLRASGLVETIRRAAAGERLIDAGIAVRSMERARERMRTASELQRLTGQETRILELLGAGLSNREIADRMALAEKTVKNYVSAVLAKLGLASRTQAALYLTRGGRT